MLESPKQIYGDYLCLGGNQGPGLKHKSSNQRSSWILLRHVLFGLRNLEKNKQEN